MAEIAAGFLGPAIEVVKCVGKPIKRQFNYLCRFTTNINNLKDEARKLDDAKEGIQLRVDRAVDDVQVIVPQVKNWLEKSNDIKEQMTAILDQVPNAGSVRFKLVLRFSLSKRAKKTAERLKELRDECTKFDVISLPGPPVASEPVLLGKTYEFESRKQIEEDIMAVLRGGDVSMVGICGMGGLGKTTMAKRIMNRVLEEHVFEETVIAVFSQNIDKRKIQLEIGGSLGLNLKDETSEAVRMQKLRTRLSGTKRILLVLDDVWQGMKLEEFGIPRDSKGCTILITSRNTDALRAMDVQKEFAMKILPEEEARFLFREKVGTCIDGAKLKSLAERVVEECKGLPIALATVGAALKDEKNPSIWSDALLQMNECDPDIPDYIANVYNPLKLSYDFLSSKQAKSVFLLCCLFPEDLDIPLELLAYFGMGLSIFNGIQKLEDVRNRVSMLIKMLKSRSLLLDSEESDCYAHAGYVRMHDIVRDVCIFIAKQERYVGINDCSWVSFFQLFGERTKLPTGLGSPNLRLLIVGDDPNSNSEEEEEGVKLDNAFFERISDLHVLSILGYESLTSLPLTHSLKNLKSLVLSSCHGLETISIVGELVYLEVLNCYDCSSINELPLGIKRLNRLKLLDLSGCYNLQSIGQGIISSLLGLEELKMLNSFNRWESKDREERENAGLRELEALTNLRCLEIEIEDQALATEKMHLSSKIKRFRICIGKRWFGDFDVNDHSYNKRMVLELKREEPCLGDTIEVRLLRETEYLYLSGNGANSVDLAKCHNIRWLELRECETVKNIITTSMVEDATAIPASIEHLILDDLPELEGICDGPISSNSFHNLKELKLIQLDALEQLWKSSRQNINVPPLLGNLSSIHIEGCDNLCNLGQLSMAGKDCLLQLQELVIKGCEMMEQVFLWNEEDESQNDHCIIKVFPKLKNVVLYDLPNVATLYQGMGGFEFPLLSELSIVECPKLKSMGTNHNSGRSSTADIDDDSSHLLCQPKKLSFVNLKELQLDRHPFCGHKIMLSYFSGLELLTFYRLYGCTSLFSSSVAENLLNLRVLCIFHCDEMLKVIEDNKEEEEKLVASGGEMTFLFPKLEILELEGLPKLVTFCEWKCDVKLLSLRNVTVLGSPDMENWSLGFLAAPNLEAFTTDFNNNLEIGVKVSFDSLKKLVIQNSKKPFYDHKSFMFLFNGLKELEVSFYSMSFLFTPSIARHLDSLVVLLIHNCNEMVKVIEDDEEVASGGKRTLLLPKLKKLELMNLSKLVSFCEWKCDIELPSLRNVAIRRCPVLKTFTAGLIAAAPNLENVEVEDKEIGGGTKDLNSVVQEYMARVEMKEIEGGEEEEETKGEIEEEETQN